jgi:hypothetical protein
VLRIGIGGGAFFVGDYMGKLSELKPQRRNANRHTQRGLGLLEKSVQQDGWIGAITVAADGETFDGSARIEVGVATGFEDAIIVESDGTRPIIHRRTDIPTANDPRAVRLGVAANRVAQTDLAWDVALLSDLHDEGIIGDLFSADEIDALLDLDNDTEKVRFDADTQDECCPTCGRKLSKKALRELRMA